MLRFVPLSVLAVDRIAEDAVCVSLQIPPTAREFEKFEAGQYVTVRRTIGGREERRTYSIVTPPGSAVLRLGVRVQPGGRMSQELANRLRPGDALEVGAPVGRFRTAVDASRGRAYVAFAAGSGITPVLSLAAHILEREPLSRFVLVYGNRSTARTMFLEETLALKNRHLDRFLVHFVMSREPQQTEIMNGRIDAQKVRALAERLPEIAAAQEYFVCGPGGMVDEVRGALAALNPQAPVRVERFSAGTPQGAPGGTPAAPADGAAPRAPEAAAPRAAAAPRVAAAPHAAPLAEISIVMDGRRRSFPMAAQDASVLEAAERAGLALPFSCRSGICATCRARIVAGKAVMTHNIALEPWEIEAGFILCCQARPTTPDLALTYDEK